MNGSQVTTAFLGNVPSNWTLAGVGDFNGDGSTDILWRDATDSAVAIWFLNGTAMDSVAGFGGVPGNFQITQTGDYNGDGKTDILWNDGSSHYAALVHGGRLHRVYRGDGHGLGLDGAVAERRVTDGGRGAPGRGVLRLR